MREANDGWSRLMSVLSNRASTTRTEMLGGRESIRNKEICLPPKS
jgi:hypothetical protein